MGRRSTKQTGQFMSCVVYLSWRARKMLSGVRAAVICGSIVIDLA